MGRDEDHGLTTRFVSDVHGAFGALARLAVPGPPLVILGDLANLTDYRSGEGAVAEVLGIDFARSAARARALGDYDAMRGMWARRVGGAVDDVRAAIGDEISRQYEGAREALEGGKGLVIHGNVDRPELMVDSLPDGFDFVHGEVRELEGLKVGFAGGGVATPLGAAGEVSDSEMSNLLEGLGRVDVLCTHVAPALAPLRRDVVTGREERGSLPVLEYIRANRPLLHLFGDVHQPQASTWRLGRTRCLNVGYFRATGRYLALSGGEVSFGRVG